MSQAMSARIGGGCGALFVLLLFGGSATGIEALMYAEIIGLVLFIPFLAYLTSVLRTAEGEGAWLAMTAFGAGLVDVAIKLGSAAPSLASENLVEGSALDNVLHDMNNASFILTMAPLGILTAAVATVVLATGVLPRWLGWLTALTSAALFANGAFLDAEFGPAFLLFLVWIVAVSVTLVRRASGRQADAKAIAVHGQGAAQGA